MPRSNDLSLNKMGAVTDFLDSTSAITALSPVEKSNTQQCKKRAQMFVEYCKENGRLPSVELLCLFMGRSRQSLYKWERDETCENGRIVGQMKALINACLTELAASGTANFAYVIFQQKSNFGYVEQQSIQIEATPNSVSAPKSREAIRAELGEFVTDEQIDSADFPPLPEI